MTLQSNLTVTILGLIATLSLLYNFKQKSVEGFAGLNFPMTYKINREVDTTCGSRSGSCNNNFSVSGNYQASLSPRFSNVDYGSNLRYNIPDQKHLAVPPHPISYKSMVDNVPVENYTPVCDLNRVSNSMYPKQMNTKCTVGQSNICGSSAAPRQIDEPTSVQHMLPVTDMRTINCTTGMQTAQNQNSMVQATMNRGGSGASCSVEQNARGGDDCGLQPVVYDRFIYANSRSRLKQGSDWIRGDLPIVPVLPEANVNSQVWMRPSVTPHIDLNPGAMNVLGGFDNTTNNQLRALMNASTDGTLQTFGGQATYNQRSTVCGPAQDVVVSSFA